MENQNLNNGDVKIPKKVGVVETYAADMVKVMEKNEGGIIKKVIHEEEERDAIKKNISPESGRNRSFMFIGIGLILLSITILTVFIFLSNKIFTVDVGAQFSPIIFTDKTGFVDVTGLTKDEIFESILNEADITDVKYGGIEGIYLSENKKVIGLRRFLTLIKSSFPMDQIASVTDNFLLGVLNNQTETTPTYASEGFAGSEGISGSEALLKKVPVGKDLFILLKTKSFIDVFPTMKSWENKMFYDLHGLFGINIDADNKYLLTKDFEDGVVGNKNAHILRDNDGNTVFEYVFADDTSVIITNKDEAAQEVMLRLSVGQVKK
jgi:hypothetical protein